MSFDPANIRVKDLFFDLQGVEKHVFLLTDDSNVSQKSCLFSKDDCIWEPLNRLSDMLKSVTSINPREIEIGSRNLSVKLNTRCLYPCVQDVYFQNPPYPLMDKRSMLLRGGLQLKCDASAKLIGPAYIGQKVQFRHNAGILGQVVIGDGLSYRIDVENSGEPGAGGILGHGVTVRSSIIRSGVKIAAYSEVAYSIVGKNVQIGPGTQFAHENFSLRPVLLSRFNGQTIKSGPVTTGRVKLGAIIGDDCQIGANVTMHPGVVLLPGCKVHGGQVLQSGIYSSEHFNQHIPK